jgi:hypothetical protein
VMCRCHQAQRLAATHDRDGGGRSMTRRAPAALTGSGDASASRDLV